MGELLDCFKERFTKDNRSETKDMMNKQRVKNAIADLCNAYLSDIGQEFIFEVSPKDLQYAVVVIDEEPLKSRYTIMQISDSLFSAKLQEISLDMEGFNEF